LLGVLLLILHGVALPAQQPRISSGDSAVLGQQIIIQPGGSGMRSFGDLLVRYTLGESASSIQCTLYVNTVFAGIGTLSATSPAYTFDVQVDKAKASGRLSLNLLPSLGRMQASTLNGDFTYTYTPNNTTINFKGVLIAWYSGP